ncbi:MAG: hypothetical protein Q8P22_00140 [Chloroflexota bacterium]|nr:hypothetical protein [Chloroflexota bacterium]
MERQQRLLLSLFAMGAFAMLLGALGDREYSYYTLLRWIVFFAAVLVGILGFRWRHVWAVGVFAFVAILFNPVAPVKLSESLWFFIDIGAAVLFLLAAVFVAPPGAVARLLSKLKQHRVWVGLAVGGTICLTVAALVIVLLQKTDISFLINKSSPYLHLARSTLTAYDTTNEEFDKAFPLLKDMGISLGRVPNSMDMLPDQEGGEVRLTPQQRVDYQQFTYSTVRRGLTKIVAKPDFQALTDERKKLVVERAMTALKDDAHAQFRGYLRAQGVTPPASEPVGAGGR